MNKTYITTAEFAERCGVTPRRVRVWLAAGLIPGALKQETAFVTAWLIPADAKRPDQRPPGNPNWKKTQ